MEKSDIATIRQLARGEARKTCSKKPKAGLTDMLIACNDALDAALSGGKNPVYMPVPAQGNRNCTDLAHCPNPCGDCINCPLRGYGSGGMDVGGGRSTSTGDNTTLINENEQ